MRVFFQYLLPLLLPSLAFVGYVLLIRNAEDERSIAARLHQGPWFWLLLSGCILAFAALATTALLQSDNMSKDYHPPRIEDGRVVPGGFD